MTLFPIECWHPLLDECTQRAIGILGIEGFRVEDGFVTPVQVMVHVALRTDNLYDVNALRLALPTAPVAPGPCFLYEISEI